MANYVPFMRSNYFKVKDPQAFEAFCKKWDLELIKTPDPQDPQGQLFGCVNNGETGLPCGYYDKEKDEFVEEDFMKTLSGHLCEGWVAVVREVGYEKMRYLVGFTVAVNSAGRSCVVDLDAIYDRARRLGKHVTQCSW